MGSQDAKKIIEKFSLDERRVALRKFRKECELTQGELASRSGLNESTISRYERGSRDLSPEAFARVQKTIVNVMVERRAAKEQALEREADYVSRLVPISSTSEVRRMGNLSSLSGLTPLELLKARLQTSSDALIAVQEELIGCLREFVALHESESQQKDIRIGDLEKKVHELRHLYELETEVAVKGAQAEELREKLSASAKQEKAKELEEKVLKSESEK